MCEQRRYYVSADKFGWSVRDRDKGEFPNHARVGYMPATSFRSMEAAKSAAEAMADKLNAEDGGVTVRPGDGDSRTARGTSEEDT